MQLYNTTNDGMFQKLDRLCASSTNTYPFRNKVDDLNESLDWYCDLAFKTDGQWSFDDINQTSPPIDTQSIVSGTNRYKFGSFTEKIIDLIRLEILDANGNGLSLIPEMWGTLGSSTIGNASGIISGTSGQTFQNLYLNAPSGTPTHYMKFGDFVYLRPKPNYNIAAGLKAYFNRAALRFSFVTFTVTIASPGVFTSASHGLVAGDTVILNTDGALPTGLTVDTQYYVISAGLGTDTFRLSTTSGGSAIDTSGSQSGTHSFLKTSASPGIQSMHHPALIRHTAYTYLKIITSPRFSIFSQDVMKDEKNIEEYFTRRSKDTPKRLVPAYQNNR